jgi:hypothetical protein
MRCGRSVPVHPATPWEIVPKRVAEQLLEVIAHTTATELALSIQVPGLDPKLALKSLKRFGTEVLPRLREK